MGVRTIQYATPITFGAGALDTLAEVVRSTGAGRVLLLGDRGVEAAGLVGRVLERLAQLRRAVFLDIPAHATERTVFDAATLFAAEGCDGIVAVGGGSVIDAAKAVALCAAAPGPLARFAAGRETVAYPSTMPPVVAVPTTAGTGSEISRGLAVSTGTKRLVLLSPRLLPAAAVCDPGLTLSLPAALTAATAVDALSHCIEGYLSPNAAAPYQAVALDGAQRLFSALPRVLAEPGSIVWRGEVMLGALEGGMAMPLGLGAAHALGVPLDGAGLHHGTVIAALLEPVLRFYAGHLGAKQAALACALGLPQDADLAAALAEFVRNTGLPTTLPASVLQPDVAAGAVQSALDGHYHRSSPRLPSSADYRAILDEAAGAVGGNS